MVCLNCRLCMGYGVKLTFRALALRRKLCSDEGLTLETLIKAIKQDKVKRTPIYLLRLIRYLLGATKISFISKHRVRKNAWIVIANDFEIS